MNERSPIEAESRKAALAFIHVTIFIDVMGFGLIAPIMPQLFHLFTEPGAPVYFPGISYFTASLMLVASMMVVAGVMRRRPRVARATVR